MARFLPIVQQHRDNSSQHALCTLHGLNDRIHHEPYERHDAGRKRTQHGGNDDVSDGDARIAGIGSDNTAANRYGGGQVEWSNPKTMQAVRDQPTKKAAHLLA